jgi:hypothetical protein
VEEQFAVAALDTMPAPAEAVQQQHAAADMLEVVVVDALAAAVDMLAVVDMKVAANTGRFA